jgi:hypothetical protein
MKMNKLHKQMNRKADHISQLKCLAVGAKIIIDIDSSYDGQLT